MPNPLCLALDYSPCALIGQRGFGVWGPIRCARPDLLQVAARRRETRKINEAGAGDGLSLPTRGSDPQDSRRDRPAERQEARVPPM